MARKCRFEIRSFPALFAQSLALFLAIAPSSARAQYQLLQWGNFEDGKLPADSEMVGKDSKGRVSVVDLGSVTGMPPEFHSSEESKETEKMGLLLKAEGVKDATDPRYAGLTFSKPLQRDTLGEKGCAIYQADFYMPPMETSPPLNFAVLAMAPITQKPGELINPQSYYRFGVLGQKAVYFSFMEPGKPTATVYRNDDQLLRAIPRPGWHRFAIVFEGQEQIRCYVDGREASFSPLKESTLRELSVGVVATWRKEIYDIYVDNLSIQFTTGETVMPVSPYGARWAFPAGPASMRTSGAKETPPTKVEPEALAEVWMEPGEAWRKAQAEKKPLLLYFHAPGIPACDQMEELLKTSKEAKEYVARHSCARVDINQLKGGEIARKYSVFKVPTFLVVAPDAQSHKIAIFRRNDTWENFAKGLGDL